MKILHLNELNGVKVVINSILKRFFIQEKIHFFSLILVIVISSVLSVLAPYIFSLVINEINENNYLTQFSTGLFIYAILIGLSLVFKDAVTYIAVIMAEKIKYISSMIFFNKLIQKSSTFFIKYNPAEIQAMQDIGISALNRGTQLLITYFIPAIIQVVLSCLLLGIKLNVTVMLIILLYGVFFISVAYYANKNINKYLDVAINEEQLKAQIIGNTISMIETLRYFNAGIWIEKKIKKASDVVLKNITLYALKNIQYSIVFGVGICIQFFITFYIFIPEVQAGHLNIGDLVLFNTLLLQLNKPFEYIGMCILEFNAAYIELKPFAKMWNVFEFYEQTNQKRILKHNIGKLQFNTVSFHYENGKGIENISFNAQRGRIVFLFGESGKGKSTIFKLALKELELERGEILINDIPLNCISRNEWFSKIGVIPQEVMLLNDSIQNNICLGRNYDQNKLYRAAEKAQILTRILEMQDGFDTVIGERGLMLSGGEKQRIAIARALYAEPEFLFLDEASSSLDQETEIEFMSYIRTLQNDVTIIVITHQKSLMNSNDYIFHL
ncbi:hypothetical protein B9T31_05795 [Acinetobacter sp. ANC 4558]|uniref:ABC transporter ATP-binding protein n=1 Tax=Acinetobacter sp. ANC 4558 TaxID=1977876 RepID=UPI000A346433|nr:ABC transporter ATP-binding protein [Acinetobacter sp. ANC 4558]OTG87118.1 hypothetical protein B9T31_05795 [Acinetobacter sp. ANC 4558]